MMIMLKNTKITNLPNALHHFEESESFCPLQSLLISFVLNNEAFFPFHPVQRQIILSLMYCMTQREMQCVLDLHLFEFVELRLKQKRFLQWEYFYLIEGHVVFVVDVEQTVLVGVFVVDDE